LEKKPLEMTASIELWPALTLTNMQSPMYALKYGREGKRYSDAYSIKSEGSARYQLGALLAAAAGALGSGYVRIDDTVSYYARLYECYLKYSPVTAFSVETGKELFKWGKGYSFNPVAFAARPKDLNDLDATLEGYWAAAIEFIGSCDEPLSTIALTGVVVPAYRRLNEGYLSDRNVAGMVQAYFLLLNTDTDAYLYGDSKTTYKAGGDMSRNIIPEWEVHAECVWPSDKVIVSYDTGMTITSRIQPVWETVVGTRYLAPINTTFIVEYLHTGGGHVKREMDAYYNAIENARQSADPTDRRMVIKNGAQYYGGQFTMTDYLYLKASYPDPFNIVYLTPAVYAIVNINDGSLMGGAEGTYTRFRRMGFTFRYVAFAGGARSEYGMKQAQHKIELRFRSVF
jgi:hypothetical protein